MFVFVIKKNNCDALFDAFFKLEPLPAADIENFSFVSQE